MRTCSECGNERPETPEFFEHHEESCGGLRAQCRGCRNRHNSEWRQTRIVEVLENKTCTGCGAVKACDDSNFHPLKNGRGGFAARCKVCTSKYHNDRYASKRELLLDRNRKSRAKHGEKWANDRLTRGWISVLLAGMRASAKRRGHTVEIDEVFIRGLWEKQNGLCYWFGIPLVPSSVRRDPQRPSVDRLDNAKGYVPGNVVLSCMAANTGRSECSAGRFGEFCALLRATAIAT